MNAPFECLTLKQCYNSFHLCILNCCCILSNRVLADAALCDREHYVS